MVHFRNGDTVSKGRHSENVFGMADLRNSGFRNGGPSEWRPSEWRHGTLHASDPVCRAYLSILVS